MWVGEPQEAITRYGLSSAGAITGGRREKVWPGGVWVHPNEFPLSSLEDAAKKFTLLTSTKEDWYCALVQVNEDAQHLPLSNARHISILIDGAPSRRTCEHLSQLEVCQLLHWVRVVIYHGGLNGGLEPVWVTLLKLPLWEMESTSKDT